MGQLANLFSFGNRVTSEEMPILFELGIRQADFVNIDTVVIYSKILTDVFTRSVGLTEDHEVTLWDNCLASESAEGLITRIAKAMNEKSELILKYDPATKLLFVPKNEEVSAIKAAYEKPVGEDGKAIELPKNVVYISFKNAHRADLVRTYSALEYCTVAALNKAMNVAKAIQFKLDNLRASTSSIDSNDVKAQAVKIANGLKEGKDVMLDAKDILDMLKPDLEATKAGMELINQKRSFYLGMPASYITGILNSGLGDSGKADSKAIERGLRVYFYSIARPVCKALFGVNLEFKSEDFDLIDTALNVLRTFESTSNEFLSKENKTIIVNRAFGLGDDEEGDEPEAPTDPVNGKPVDPNAPPAAKPGEKTPPAKPKPEV